MGIALLTTKNKEIADDKIAKIDYLIRTNIRRIDSVEDALFQIRDRVAAIINRWDNMMPLCSTRPRVFHI